MLPVTEPFDGPAILSGRAAAVFFHEVLGHRLEGQRQRGDDEGQTFTHDLGKPILPDFLSVSDDPTRQTVNGNYLSGYYSFDDEGQPSRRVDLISQGVLQGFLMSRLPIASFDSSNGHGRAQPGRMPTGRQGNLMVTSNKSVSDAELRRLLVEQAKKQGKPYGLFFEDISSGFAVTTRSMPQAFQVLPLVVYRVYVDGRPDELVRGVSIVGTPQAALSRIAATGTHPEVFNGECGAESGNIPVSAVAPAMLVTEIETQRQPQGTARIPILLMPSAQVALAGAQQCGRESGAIVLLQACLESLLSAACLAASLMRSKVPKAALVEPTTGDAQRDPVLSSMLAELERSQQQLQLQNFQKPFFLQYRLDDIDDYQASANFGAPTGERHDHRRLVRVTVRVGDYKMDSSSPRGDGSLQVAAVEDDLVALRTALWSATDTAYKAALRDYTQKQIALKAYQTQPHADDFSREKSIVVLDPTVKLDLDTSSWQRRIAEASGLFQSRQSFEQVTEYSAAGIHARAVNRYLVNSEGTVVRTGTTVYQLTIALGTQAPDGMRIDPVLCLHGKHACAVGFATEVRRSHA